MTINKTGGWIRYSSMLTRAADKGEATLNKSLAKQANFLATDIKRNITDGGRTAGVPFLPLKPSTIARKGSSAPLIDSGDMRNSVKATKLGQGEYLVGITGSEKGENGVTIAEYARIHEFGGITEKGNLVPARPFIGPTVKAKKEERIKEIDKEIKGMFGL